jgi:hypothetical protein
MYEFRLKQGSYEIYSNYYTHYSHLGFADSMTINFMIPHDALPGMYKLHISYNWWTQDHISIDAFQIYETRVDGKVFFDNNQNGIRDAGENGIPHQTISFNPGGTTVLTDLEGNYFSHLNIGTFTDSVMIPPTFTLTSAPYHTVTVPPDTVGLDFGLYTPPSTVIFHELICSNSPIRCFRESSAFWSIKSMSNNIQDGTITMLIDDSLIFISSDITPDYISNDTIRWNYSLQPFQSLTANVVVQGGAAGTITGFDIMDTVFDPSGTNVSAYNVSSQVRCAYDPNDKSVFPEGVDSLHHYTLLHENLRYTIRFQNCGSDTAFNINIIDTMDMKLDMSTFKILYSSSPMTTQITGDRIVRFIFDNIQLPDSNIDELHSHGMVIYSISPKSTINEFNIIRNTAYIYFDYNPAVVTNTAFNTMVSNLNVGLEESINYNRTLIFPNPITDKSLLVLPDKKEFILNIFDVNGRKMLNTVITENYNFKGRIFPPGIYYYQLVNNSEDIFYNGNFIVIQ